MRLKFNVFGKVMWIYRESNNWALYRDSEMGMLSKVYDVVIPSELEEGELVKYLDDIYHELANERYPSVFRVD